MRIGIDFGTSNTAAAVMGSDGNVRMIPLDPAAPDARTMRTLLYVERDGVVHVGANAVRMHREHHLGRVPRFERQWLGFLDIDVAEFTAKGYEIKGGSTIVDVYADVDADTPGRLLHSLKTPLASDYAGTRMFGEYRSLEALIGMFLSRVRVQAEAATGEPADDVVIGRPVHFAGAASPEDDARAQARLGEAARLAGFSRVEFELEPVAAGLAAAHAAPVKQAETILVFDFGGGTLDLAVLLLLPAESPRVLATGGLGMAGDHFDRALFQQVMLPWFGQGVQWGAHQLAFPTHILAALGDWQDVPALCTEENLAFIRAARRECSDPLRLLALDELISRGHAYDVYAAVERAKVDLSSARFAVIAHQAGAIDVWQPVTRGQFDRYIARERRAVDALVTQVLAEAGLHASAITRVVRTGGSSSIPAFVTGLERQFGPARITSTDLFTAVASGLAIRAAK